MSRHRRVYDPPLLQKSSPLSQRLKNYHQTQTPTYRKNLINRETRTMQIYANIYMKHECYANASANIFSTFHHMGLKLYTLLHYTYICAITLIIISWWGHGPNFGRFSTGAIFQKKILHNTHKNG